MVLCASPDYLQRARHARSHPPNWPTTRCIAYSLLATGRRMAASTGREGRSASRSQPRMRTNSGDTCRAAALAHQGIVLQPTFLVGDDLRGRARWWK